MQFREYNKNHQLRHTVCSAHAVSSHKWQVGETCSVAACFYKAANITQVHQKELAALCNLLSEVLFNFQLSLWQYLKHND